METYINKARRWSISLLGVAVCNACCYSSTQVIPELDASVVQRMWVEQTEPHARMLLEIGETSIAQPSGMTGESIIRLSWSRPFRPHVVIKLTINSEKKTAVVTTWIIDPGKSEGRISRTERSAKYGSVGAIRAAIDSGDFGSLSPVGSMYQSEVSSWFIETQNGTYWAVCRIAPTLGDLVYVIGRQLIELSIGSDLLPVY